MSLPLIVFDDLELWGTGYLRTALDARPEPHTHEVHVGVTVPTTRLPRMVIIRRDGGRRLDATREAARLGVNVWGSTDQEASDLARLVAALLWSAPDGRPVCKVTQTSGPSPIPDAQPRRYMTFELIVRGANL